MGGIIETTIKGLEPGIGEPYFDSLESDIAKAIFSIPAVKGIEFGLGFGFASKKGSEVNDPFEINEGKPAKIRKINIIGAKAFNIEDLKDELRSREAKILRFGSSEIYDPVKVEFDKEKRDELAVEIQQIALNEDGTFDFSSYDTGLMPAQERALNENINLLREYSNSLMAAEVAQDNYNQAIVDSALENTNLSKSEKAFTS